MADKLLIVLVNSDPENGAELSPPFFQATVAAAMDYDVEIVLTGKTTQLALEGVAEKIIVSEDNNKTLYSLIKDADDAGVIFKVCTPSIDIQGRGYIPEIDETVGGAYVISEAMDDSTVTFTY